MALNETEWEDLSERAAGASLGAKAEELRSQAPVRSFLARLLRAHTEEQAWRKGGKGEAKVGRTLAKLPDGWHVIHSVDIGDRGADIDHVVIGPAGVFTLNTKNHRGKKLWVGERAFLVNGQKVDYLNKSAFEGRRASALLYTACGFEVEVHPVLVIAGGELNVKQQPRDVAVVDRLYLRRWLALQDERLSPEVVAAVFEHARRSTTWRGHPQRPVRTVRTVSHRPIDDLSGQRFHPDG